MVVTPTEVWSIEELESGDEYGDDLTYDHRNHCPMKVFPIDTVDVISSDWITSVLQ